MDPLPLRSRNHAVYSTLRQEILGGRLAPGSELDLAGLAARFSCQQPLVTETLASLASEALVVKSECGGYRVAPVSLEEFQDIYETRVLIESGLAKLAASRATKEDIDEVAAELEAIKSAALASRGPEMLMALRRFHFRIYAITGNQRLIELVSLLWDQSQRYRSVFLSEGLEDVVTSHARVLEKLAKNDEKGCESAMARDLRLTMRRADSQFNLEEDTY